LLIDDICFSSPFSRHATMLIHAAAAIFFRISRYAAFIADDITRCDSLFSFRRFSTISIIFISLFFGAFVSFASIFFRQMTPLSLSFFIAAFAADICLSLFSPLLPLTPLFLSPHAPPADAAFRRATIIIDIIDDADTPAAITPIFSATLFRQMLLKMPPRHDASRCQRYCRLPFHFLCLR
jgi:hypothetical protein